MGRQLHTFRAVIFILALWCTSVLLAGCGGAAAVPDNGNIGVGDQNTTAPPAYQMDELFSEVPTIPWDDEGSLHGTSDASGNAYVVLGSEFLQKHNAEVIETSLVMTGRDRDAEGEGPALAYGLYKVEGLTGKVPVALGVECLPAGLGHHYFIGVADYANGQWVEFGPITTPEYELDLAGNDHRFVSRLGNLYFILVVPPGHSATHSRSTLYFRDGEGGGGGSLPAVPRELEATDGAFEHKIVVEWIEADGAASYEVFRKPTEIFHSASEGDGDWVMVGEPETNRFVDEDVEPGRVYLYKARSVNDHGKSEFSNTDEGYAQPAGGTPPGHPFELSASDGTFENMVKLEWAGGEGAAWFRIQRQDVEPVTEWTVIGESEGHTFIDDDVEPGKHYRYRVQAVNEFGQSEWSNTDTGYAAEGGGGDPPGHPFELWASDGTYENGVKLEWAGGEGADWFVVERRSAEGEGEWSIIADPEVNTYFDESAEPGVVYKYRVKAGNEFGESEYSNIDTGYRASGGSLPSKPIELWATDGEFENYVKIQWDGGEGAGWFRLERQDVEPQTEWTFIGESETHQFIDDDVIPGKHYRYRAQAANGHGHSEWSNTDTGYAAGGGGEGYSISGNVWKGEHGLPCAVTLLVVGDDEVTVETGENGHFLFDGLSAGTYIVYPQHPLHRFTPDYQVVHLTPEHPVAEVNFSAWEADDTHQAFGFVYSLVSGEGGLQLVPLGGTNVVAWQEDTEFEVHVTTNEDGYFRIFDLPDGAVLFKPTKEGYVFVPTIHDATISGEGIPNALNFRGQVAE